MAVSRVQFGGLASDCYQRAVQLFLQVCQYVLKVRMHILHVVLPVRSHSGREKFPFNFAFNDQNCTSLSLTDHCGYRTFSPIMVDGIG